MAKTAPQAVTEYGVYSTRASFHGFVYSACRTSTSEQLFGWSSAARNLTKKSIIVRPNKHPRAEARSPLLLSPRQAMLSAGELQVFDRQGVGLGLGVLEGGGCGVHVRVTLKI